MKIKHCRNYNIIEEYYQIISNHCFSQKISIQNYKKDKELLYSDSNRKKTI